MAYSSLWKAESNKDPSTEEWVKKRKKEWVSKLRYIHTMEDSIAAAPAKLLQSCLTLCDPIDGSPPGSPVPGILQVRTVEWVAISFSNAWKWKVKVKSLSCVRLLATPWTAAYQAPPSNLNEIKLHVSIGGLLWWLSSKESICNAGDSRDSGSIPGSGRSPGGGHGNPLQYSCLENPIHRGACLCSPSGCKDLDRTEASTHARIYRDKSQRHYWGNQVSDG